jgi:two-component system, LytTR family, sensor kinase
MRPVVFIAAWVGLGGMFALQDYAMVRSWNYQVRIGWLILADVAYFSLWGGICQILWWSLRAFMQQATLKRVVLVLVPLSLIVSVLQEAIWVACFPNFPLESHSSWTYLHRLHFYLNEELINNLVIFWVAFGMFRSVGYYQKFREKEYAAVRLENELTNAQLRALRMQLNPHFLFNTMNSISSLMRSDVESADQMLEQMSSMLRMTLERGDAQLIPLTEEIEFVQLYLGIQQMRFRGKAHCYVAIDPEVLGALVPTMILQPLVENAYVHGVAKTVGEGFLGIEAQNQNGQLRICVRNSGCGLNGIVPPDQDRAQFGLANVKGRLELHYGDAHRFTMEAFPDGEVHAILLLPLGFASRLSGRMPDYADENQNDYRG